MTEKQYIDEYGTDWMTTEEIMVEYTGEYNEN